MKKILIILAGLSLCLTTGCQYGPIAKEVAENYSGIVDDVRAAHTQEEIATWRDVNGTTFDSIERRAYWTGTKEAANKLGDLLGPDGGAE